MCWMSLLPLSGKYVEFKLCHHVYILKNCLNISGLKKSNSKK